MNLELLKHAKKYIEKMANGINPLTGEIVPDNDLINNIRISRCLFYVNNILGEVLENSSKKNNKQKTIPFNLNKDEINKFEYTNESLSISMIVKKINELNSNEEMKRLKVTDMCKWLIKIGLLVEVEENNKKVKRPTEIGKDMGIYVEHRFGTYGSYDIVLYPREMQEFIIDNFNSLLEYINSNE